MWLPGFLAAIGTVLVVLGVLMQGGSFLPRAIERNMMIVLASSGTILVIAGMVLSYTNYFR